ncbi:hypothetical protein CJJ23_02795, partial [Mycoplasmopsis agassizii]
WLDNVINANPDVIFIQSAGNDGDVSRGYDKYGAPIKRGYEFELAKYTDSYKLSLNSIVVGAVKEVSPIVAQDFSEWSRKDNYITTSVPDTFEQQTGLEPADTEKHKNGTSYSAPSVTAMISFLKNNYSNYFDKGADSLIAKSALISGSRNNYSTKFKDSYEHVENHLVYEQKIGFGVANFSRMKESLENLDYFVLRSSNGRAKPRSKSIYLSAGDKYRVNITWKNQDSLDWVLRPKSSSDTPAVYDKHFIGPTQLGLTIVKPDNHYYFEHWTARTITATNFTNISGETQRVNTKTIEFKAETSGTYRFNVYFENDDARSKDMDVALTYSKI